MLPLPGAKVGLVCGRVLHERVRFRTFDNGSTEELVCNGIIAMDMHFQRVFSSYRVL